MTAEGSEFWRDRRWWKRLGNTTVASAIAALMTMLSVVAAARGLGPDGYGLVVLAVAVTSLVARFLDLTLTEAVVHYGHRALAADDRPGLRTLFRVCLRIDIVVGVAVSAGLVLAAGPLAAIASDGGIDPALVRVAALVILTSTAEGTIAGVLLVVARPDLREWARAGGGVFRVVGTLAAILLGGGAEAVLLSYALSGLAGSLLLGAIAWRVAWKEWSTAPDGPLPVGLPKLLRFSFHTSVTTSVTAVGESVFPLLIGNLSGPGTVGIFRVALLPALAARMASTPMQLMLFPEQARLSAHGKPDELRRAMRGYSALAGAVALPVGIVAWFAMPVLIEVLFGSEFDSAVGPARILLVAAVVQFTLAWSKMFHAAVGRPHIRTILESARLVMSLGILVWLGDQGAEGAAWAYTIASVSTAAVWLVVVHRYLAREIALAEARPRTAEEEEQLEAEQIAHADLERPSL